MARFGDSQDLAAKTIAPMSDKQRRRRRGTHRLNGHGDPSGIVGRAFLQCAEEEVTLLADTKVSATLSSNCAARSHLV